MEAQPDPRILRFGTFELDAEGEELRKSGRLVRLPPQPFKLLLLLASRPGRVVTREEIRRELWADDTFVDFDQGVNFAVKQIREALSDAADSPVYVQTIPRKGYRFIAPVEPVSLAPAAPAPRTARTDVALLKAMWTNIAEIRLAEVRRRRRTVILTLGLLALLTLVALRLFVRS
jgi:DNA-binding winged helix-turn-helix (wHTH) protein